MKEFRESVTECDERTEDNPYSRIAVWYPLKTLAVSESAQ